MQPLSSARAGVESAATARRMPGELFLCVSKCLGQAVYVVTKYAGAYTTQNAELANACDRCAFVWY